MINVAAIRMQQFGVQFYQASLTAEDIDKLVRFEVLNYGESGQPAVRGGKKKAPSKVNWDLLERRIASSEKAYQRQLIRRKIDELVQYYEQCRQARDLPSIPGAVIISCDEKLAFEPMESGAVVGRLKVPEREGILRAIDGQHRLLALHADIDNFRDQEFSVPAIVFDRLPEDHVVQMFVTINAKHTRLNPSHLVSLSGRQLYRDDALAAAHDVVRALNDREDSPLHGEIIRIDECHLQGEITELGVEVLTGNFFFRCTGAIDIHELLERQIGRGPEPGSRRRSGWPAIKWWRSWRRWRGVRRWQWRHRIFFGAFRHRRRCVDHADGRIAEFRFGCIDHAVFRLCVFRIVRL